MDRDLELRLTEKERSMLMRAHMARTLKKYDRAEAAYQKLLAHSPNLIDIHRELAEIYVDQKKWKEAIKGYKEVIFLDPDDLESRLQFARILLWDKQFDAAENELLLLSEAHSDDAEVLEELVDLYLEKEEWEKALAQLDHLIEANPDSRPLHMQRGRVLTWSLQYEAAIEAFTRVLELFPNYYDARKEIAFIYGWQKNWDEAEKRLLELTEENPSDLDVRKELAQIYFYQNKYEEANKVYSQIITFNPQAGLQLSGRLSELRALRAPVLSGNYFYFHETDRDNNTSSDNHQWVFEYSWPHNSKIQPTLISGYRFDSVTRNTPIFGAAVQYKLLPRLWIEPRIIIEPNKKINPKRRLRLTANYTHSPSLDFQIFNEYTRLWNDNRSNAVGLLTTLRPLKDKSFRFRHGLFYDWIHAPSDFFIRVDKRREGARLDRWLNTWTLEKDIRLTKGILWTPGYTFSYDTTDTKGHALFTNLTLTWDRLSFVANGSYAWDSDNFVYKSLGSYFSWRF